MFDAVRNNKRIVQIFLALIALPFAFFGVESYVRNVGTGDDVASIGDVKITQQQFQQTLREQQERLRAQAGGQLDPKLLDTPEARKAILDDLVDQRLLMLEASKRRMFASDDAIRRAIASIDAFKVDGKFSPERYEALLKGQGMTPAGFEAQLRQDLTLQQLAGSIGQSGLVARTVSDRVLAMQSEKRDVQEFRISLESYLDKVKLADGAARKFYDENPKQFETPEQARVEFVVLSMEAIGAQLAVSDAEVKAWYDGHKDRYVQPEERRASHILILVPEDASDDVVKAARAKIDAILQQVKRNPADFAKLAREHSQDPGSGPKGGDLGFFPRGAMVKPFEDAVTSMKAGELKGPVKTDFGWHIIQLIETRPTAAPTLDDVRDELAAELEQKAVAAEIESLTAAAKVEKPGEGIDPAVLKDETLLDK